MRKCYHYLNWARHALLMLLLAAISCTAFSQGNDIAVKGQVLSDSAALEGVTITLKSNPKVGTKTDEKGNFIIKAPANGTLIFSFVGYKQQEVEIRGENVVNVKMQDGGSSLDEVAVVAYGTQRKSTMTGAVTTINPKELKGPTSNLTTMLQGRIAGVIAYQRSGEPGNDNASFFIRGATTFGAGKKGPLILIDGIESSTNDLARLQPDDLASFSVLKDATAASVYGARGANGVYLITTKSGVEGKAALSIRYENSLSQNTSNIKMADNVTYMKLANEAVAARYKNPVDIYSQEKIAGTAAGLDYYKYPSNDWVKRLIKDNTTVSRLNMNLKGGGKIAQYYLSGTYNSDNGLLNVDKLNNFNSNIKLKNYSVRSKVDIDATPTTHINVTTYGQFDDYNGPIGGGQQFFDQAKSANPVQFPALYPSSYAPGLMHPLFGNAQNSNIQQKNGGYAYQNPYANMVSGYQQYNTSYLQARLEIKQDLDFILPGLDARMMAYTTRYAYFDLRRRYMPFYYGMNFAPGTGAAQLVYLNTPQGAGSEYLSYEPGERIINTTNYVEGALNYTHRFNKKHGLDVMMITTMRSFLNSQVRDLQASLPSRSQSVSGRMSYDYDNRYMAELTFGYNGSERFAKNHRFGFFPSAAVAWNMHNEHFFENMRGVVNRFKLRASYGLVGNEQIGDVNDRFFYLSNVNMNNPNRSATFGENYERTVNGVSVTRYENTDITWEKAYKTNLGIELGLFKNLNITADFWKERRTNILMDRGNIPSTTGLNATVRANVGQTAGKGVEIKMDYNKNFTKNFWTAAYGTFTYATSEYRQIEELPYPEPYRSRVGYPISQHWGLIAERLFVDEEEVANSPEQWGDARSGDIKYRDINGDGVVNGDGDQVPIGYPEEPEITYGFGISVGYKGLELSAFVAGNARTSLFISNEAVQPFRAHDNGYQNGLLKSIADDHYSEDNRNVYALWPRLSDFTVTNNQWTSTWWMRDASFIRLKTLEVAYNLRGGLLRSIRVKNARIYLNGVNLLVLSRFKLWDPEMGGNGLGYPPQKVFNVGINLDL